MKNKADERRNKRTASQEEHEESTDGIEFLNDHGGKPIAAVESTTAVEANAADMVGGLFDGEDSSSGSVNEEESNDAGAESERVEEGSDAAAESSSGSESEDEGSAAAAASSGEEEDTNAKFKAEMAYATSSNTQVLENMKSPEQAKNGASLQAVETRRVVKGVKKTAVNPQQCYDLLKCMDLVVRRLKDKPVEDKQHSIVQLMTMLIFGDPENGVIKLDLACQRAMEMTTESITSFLQLLLSGSYSFISSTVSEPLLFALEGSEKALVVVSGQHRVGMLVGLLLGMFPVSTEDGLRFLKKDQTLSEGHTFTDESSPDILWGVRDYENFHNWILAKLFETKGAPKYRRMNKTFEHIFTWIACLKRTHAFREQEPGQKLLSQTELLKVLQTKQNVRFVKAVKNLVYSMLAMDKIIQRPQTPDHLMLQTCSALTAKIRNVFMNVYEASENPILMAMYNNRNMITEMDCSHSSLVDIAKAVILVFLKPEERALLLPTTSRHYNPNQWFQTLLTFDVNKVDADRLRQKLRTLRCFVDIMSKESVLQSRVKQFMVRGGAKIRDVYVLFWFLMVSPDIEDERDIPDTYLAHYFQNDPKMKVDKPFLLDRIKEKVDMRPNLNFQVLCDDVVSIAENEYGV